MTRRKRTDARSRRTGRERDEAEANGREVPARLAPIGSCHTWHIPQYPTRKLRLRVYEGHNAAWNLSYWAVVDRFLIHYGSKLLACGITTPCDNSLERLATARIARMCSAVSFMIHCTSSFSVCGSNHAVTILLKDTQQYFHVVLFGLRYSLVVTL